MLIVITMLAAAQAAPPGVAELLAATAGTWRGELQYRDYQSDRWEGLPVDVTIVAQPDGVTTIRSAVFDDGPKTGKVWITTVAMVDPASSQTSYAGFRKGRPVAGGTARLSLPTPPRDTAHWTLVSEERGIDGEGMARIRETTVREVRR